MPWRNCRPVLRPTPSGAVRSGPPEAEPRHNPFAAEGTKEHTQACARMPPSRRLLWPSQSSYAYQTSSRPSSTPPQSVKACQHSHKPRLESAMSSVRQGHGMAWQGMVRHGKLPSSFGRHAASSRRALPSALEAKRHARTQPSECTRSQAASGRMRLTGFH